MSSGVSSLSARVAPAYPPVAKYASTASRPGCPTYLMSSGAGISAQPLEQLVDRGRGHTGVPGRVGPQHRRLLARPEALHALDKHPPVRRRLPGRHAQPLTQVMQYLLGAV